MRYIGLIDCNNFFVSCERLFRPDLRNRPTVVLSSNDGCVVARSQEVKDMGIPMGVPYFKVKDILNEGSAAVFSSNFTYYRDISSRVFSTMRELVRVIEQYSIDESFFSITADSQQEAELFATSLKQYIETRVGIPVSIGLAATKTQAKYASILAKKTGGVAVLEREAFSAAAPSIRIGDIWGIGPRLARRFEATDIATVADLCAADQATIAKVFGVVGVRLQQELQGRSVYRVTEKRAVQQSIMSTRSFKSATTSLAVVEDAVAYHIRMALEDLRSMGQKAQGLQVMIRPSRHGDYLLRGGSKSVVLSEPSSDTFVFQREAMRLTQELFEAGVPYKKAGIILSQLAPEIVHQLSLDTDSTDRESREQLMSLIDGINTRFGKERVQIGGRLLGAAWAVKRDRLSPAYTTKWSDVPVVSAT